ncbi:MAG TPA: PH domain-containing protein [Candidatus Mediterraneibacter norfolkensis]|nr:PH domain-containing protein [Candidatus Mediterraneibacter norfolkensis]
MEENKKFRNHISIIIEQIGAGIVALAVLAVSIVMQNVEEMAETDMSFLQGKGMIIFLVLALFLVLSVGNRIFVWANTYICIEENAVVIERGKVNKKKNTIGIRNISNINIEQNLFEMILGTCKVKLDTNSRSTADSTDVKIVLKKADAAKFKAEITRKLQGQPEQEVCGQEQFGSAAEAEDEVFDIRAEFGDVFQHGVFSVNIFSLLILTGAVIGTVTTVLQLLEQPHLMSSLLGAAAGIVVAAGIVLSALWDTVKDFIRYYDFRAKRRGDKIYIKYGFLKKMEYTIPVDKIQALKIRQSFVARIFHRYMAEIVNVGMGDEKEEQNSFLILYVPEEKMREQLELLLLEFAPAADQKVERLPAAVWAAWAVPGVIYTAAVCASAAVCAVFLEESAVLIWLGAAGLILILLIGMLLKYLTDGSGSDGTFLKICHGYFGKNYISVRYSQIQYMEIRQNFIARAFGIRKGEIHLLASSANTSHGIPYFKGNEHERIRQGMLGM